MDKFQFWLYVIVGLIYLISRFRKKSAEQSDAPGDLETREQNQPRPNNNPTEPRQLTFEELLREISQGKSEPKTERKTPAKPYYSYEDEVFEEDQDLDDVNIDYRKEDKTVAAFEDAKRQAFFRPSLEETMNVQDTDMRFGKFKEFELQKSRNLMHEYLIGLNDPEGWKKAVVMSEILQRKF
jgi:hypothetical protein